MADCGFADIENVLKGGYRSAHVPTSLFELADFTGKLRYRYSLKEMRPIDALDENTVPTLFLHGADDRLILPANSEAMAKRTKGYSELHLIPGAGHAESVFTAPEDYRAYVKDYLTRLGFL